MGSPDSSGDGKTSPFTGGSSGGKPADLVTDPGAGGNTSGFTGQYDKRQTNPTAQKTVSEHYDMSETDKVGDAGTPEGRLPLAAVDRSTTAVRRMDPPGAGSPGAPKPFKLRG